jgi:hypothetical protein
MSQIKCKKLCKKMSIYVKSLKDCKKKYFKNKLILMKTDEKCEILNNEYIICSIKYPYIDSK